MNKVLLILICSMLIPISSGYSDGEQIFKEKITALKAEIKADEEKIEELKSAMWQKKKSLKLLNEALGIVLGVEKNEKDDELTLSLTKTII